MQPRWVTPRWDAQRHISHPPSPDDVDAAWERYPDAAGALIVSPSPYGTRADLEDIAAVCHDRGKPLIVDEAGAHLPFHEKLPTWAMDAGADVCVVSVHKMAPASNRARCSTCRATWWTRTGYGRADLLMTTSPNVMVYAAIDGLAPPDGSAWPRVARRRMGSRRQDA